ncbi:MOSC domain-containing protein [Nocardioides sp. SYSU DS0651]|uniref:MOSC domain-containing protein n=1 Tax=Nocardioides sp. SYSU DS0651 TaxID=3415955 RepID=UPI003F4CA3E7
MSVVEVGLTPVKGTRHQRRAEVVLDEHGPVGDRAFCVVDVERRKVLRTVQHRTLLAMTAAWDGEVLALEMPGVGRVAAPARPTGERVVCDYWGRSVAHDLTDGPHSELLSDVLGKPVRLAASPRGGVVYGAPVSILTTASLRDLGDRTGRTDLLETVSRFRMTMVVDAGDEPYVEDGWFGRKLGLGEATVVVEAPVPRCGVIDLAPATGAKDGSLLKALAGYRPSTGGEPWFGVDARVVTPGRLRPGDPLVVG